MTISSKTFPDFAKSTYQCMVHSLINPATDVAPSGSWSHSATIDFENGLYKAENVKGSRFPSKIISMSNANVSYLIDEDTTCNIYPMDGLPFDGTPWDG